MRIGAIMRQSGSSGLGGLRKGLAAVMGALEAYLGALELDDVDVVSARGLKELFQSRGVHAAHGQAVVERGEMEAFAAKDKVGKGCGLREKLEQRGDPVGDLVGKGLLAAGKYVLPLGLLW